MRVNSLICLAVVYPFIAFSQSGQIVLEGTYQGKNIYISNPHSTDSGFCIIKVLVNDKNFAIDKSSAFEIKLDDKGFTIGDSLQLVIMHKGDCKPSILHQSYHPRNTVIFKKIEISEEGILTWITYNEEHKLPFIVEHFRWNKWVKVGELDGKGGSGENTYEFKVTPHSGKNKFRIKQVDYSGTPRLSRPVEFTYGKNEVPAYTVSKGKNQIIFSKETMYELYDQDGNMIKRGTGTVIDCKACKKGVYYLNYDNKMGDVILK